MAIVRSNSVTQGTSGSLGNIVFRQLRGKTIMAARPESITKQSALQRENRSRFKSASAWAKAQMLDAEKKAYYWRKAKKLKLPNAYTAAISDYMRKGEIKQIDVSQYKGKAGDVIRVKAQKKDFAVNNVELQLLNADGIVIEYGLAAKKDKDAFLYRVKLTDPDKIPVRMRVVVCDHGSNKVVKDEMLPVAGYRLPATGDW